MLVPAPLSLDNKAHFVIQNLAMLLKTLMSLSLLLNMLCVLLGRERESEPCVSCIGKINIVAISASSSSYIAEVCILV